MKALVLNTYTDEHHLLAGLQSLGYELVSHRYDNRPHDSQSYYIGLAQDINPDIIVYVGMVDIHGGITLKPDILCKLREITPTIHMCGDAGDRDWWNLLETYHRHQCFTVQVSFDGSHDNPLKDYSEGLLTVTPVDARPFVDHFKAWKDRSTFCGFMGGYGGDTRGETLKALISTGSVIWIPRSPYSPYASFVRHMCNFKLALSLPWTGSHAAMHVKGRVIEAGFAGCCVVEHINSPTKFWYSDEDYITYEDLEDLMVKIHNPTPVMEHMASRFHQTTTTLYHPDVIWRQILGKAGIVV